MSIYDQVDQVSAQSSNFFKIQPGEKKVLKFDEHKIAIVDAEFDGKKKKRVRYTVVDPNAPFEEKSWEISPGHAAQLNALLRKNFMVVEITRHGGGRDTRYTFVPGA